MPDAWTEAMLGGDFERAWAISDAVLRQRIGQSCSHLPYHLRWVWDGTPLAGRDVLVRCYHGLGDTLQFIRFVPQLANIAHSIAVEAQPALLPLLRDLVGNSALHRLGAAPPPRDAAVESMELPHALRLRLDDLPGRIPYIDPRRSASLYLSQPTGSQWLRVGIVWAAGDWRRERSLPAALLLPLARLPIELFGLQLGSARADPAAARLFEAAIPEKATIAETAAQICDLDLTVTVDTMVAHLAGALGRPVWVLLDADADWRWMRWRRDSPWYPSMRLFRQPRPGIWQPVIEELVAELAEAVRPERRTRPPCSVK